MMRAFFRLALTLSIVACGPTQANTVNDNPAFKDAPRSSFLTATSGPRMVEGRYLHTATKLKDGRIFIFGGQREGENAQTATIFTSEFYDPKTNTFTKAFDHPTSYLQHDAVLLNDGRVLVFGGIACGTIPGSGLPVQCQPNNARGNPAIIDPQTGQITGFATNNPTYPLFFGDVARGITRKDGKVAIISRCKPVEGGCLSAANLWLTIFDPATGLTSEPSPEPASSEKLGTFVFSPLNDNEALLWGSSVSFAAFPSATEVAARGSLIVNLNTGAFQGSLDGASDRADGQGRVEEGSGVLLPDGRLLTHSAAADPIPMSVYDQAKRTHIPIAFKDGTSYVPRGAIAAGNRKSCGRDFCGSMTLLKSGRVLSLRDYAAWVIDPSLNVTLEANIAVERFYGNAFTFDDGSVIAFGGVAGDASSLLIREK